MGPTEEQLVKLLVEYGRPLILSLGVRADSCILMTRLGVLFMESYGYKAEPVTTICMGINAKYKELFTENRGHPEDKDAQAWADQGAYMVVVDFNDISKKTGYPGHLILKTDEFIADLSADQMHRPQHKIEASPWYRPNSGNFPQDTSYMELTDTHTGSMLLYEQFDPVCDGPEGSDRADYKLAPDWCKFTQGCKEIHLLRSLI